MRVWIAVKPGDDGGYDVPEQWAFGTKSGCEVMFAPSQGFMTVPVEVPDHPDQPKADEVQKELSAIIG